MSRIHQAIRRAEKEKAPNTISRIEFNRGSFDPELIIRRKPRIQPQLPVLHELQTPAATEPISEFGSLTLADLKPARGSKIVTLSDPTSSMSRHFHLLRERLLESRQDREIKTILITSLTDSEGKTLTAVNLALSLAQEIHQKVLLVDANLKNPCLDSLLGFASSNGLVDVLAGGIPVSESILRTTILNFYVLQAGAMRDDCRGLLSNGALRTVLADVREQFDWVILDSSSVSPLDDFELLTSVDGILLVVRPSRNSIQSVAKSVRPLREHNLLGFVCNTYR